MRRFQPIWLLMSLISLSGCALTHELQPHRLWRWNRGPAASSDPFFSVTDSSVRPVTQARSANSTDAWRPTIATDPVHVDSAE